MSERRKTLIENINSIGIQPVAVPPRNLIETVEILEEAPASGPPPRASDSGSTPLANRSGPTGQPIWGDTAVGSDTKQKAAIPDCEAYRPTNRPHTLILHILDDGSRTNGETFRLRAERTVIGRESGDVVIRHDTLMSATHAEIVRQLEGGRYRWLLRDLGSTNGTFVRVYKMLLRHDQELLIGSRRYRFRQPQASNAGNSAFPPAIAGPTRNATMGWQAVSAADLNKIYPTLVEQCLDGREGQQFTLSSDEINIGTDPKRCSVVIANDPFVSGLHAHIVKKPNGQCSLQDVKSNNGIWVRISNLPVDVNCEFQLGEQRFLLQVS